MSAPAFSSIPGVLDAKIFRGERASPDVVPDLLIEVKAAMSSGCLSESPDLSCRRTP